MPNQEKTPRRTIRIDTELWDRTKARAEQNNENIADIVRRALEDYISDDAD